MGYLDKKKHKKILSSGIEFCPKIQSVIREREDQYFMKVGHIKINGMCKHFFLKKFLESSTKNTAY